MENKNNVKLNNVTVAHKVFKDMCNCDNIKLIKMADGVIKDVIDKAVRAFDYNDFVDLYKNVLTVLQLEGSLSPDDKERLIITSKNSLRVNNFDGESICQMLLKSVLFMGSEIKRLPEFTYELREDPKPVTFDTCNTVRLSDFSDYDSEKCNNGGCYGFWTDYDRMENGNWELSFHTTADFDYCPCCGSFNDHHVWSDEDDIYDSGFSCGKFETVSTEELIDIINEFEKQHGDDDNYSIEYLSLKNDNIVSDDDIIII